MLTSINTRPSPSQSLKNFYRQLKLRSLVLSHSSLEPTRMPLISSIWITRKTSLRATKMKKSFTCSVFVYTKKLSIRERFRRSRSSVSMISLCVGGDDLAHCVRPFRLLCWREEKNFLRTASSSLRLGIKSSEKLLLAKSCQMEFCSFFHTENCA